MAKKIEGAAAPVAPAKKSGRGKFVELFTVSEGKLDMVGTFPKNISTEAKARSWIGKNGVEGTTYHVMRPVGAPITVSTVTVRRLMS